MRAHRSTSPGGRKEAHLLLKELPWIIRSLGNNGCCLLGAHGQSGQAGPQLGHPGQTQMPESPTVLTSTSDSDFFIWVSSSSSRWSPWKPKGWCSGHPAPQELWAFSPLLSLPKTFPRPSPRLFTLGSHSLCLQSRQAPGHPGPSRNTPTFVANFSRTS